MGSEESGKPKKISKPNPKLNKGLENSPQLVTHFVIASKLGVTSAGLRKWVRDREFPTPLLMSHFGI
jgi:hypothetical protein